MGGLYASGGFWEFGAKQLHDPFDFEGPLLAPQMAVGHQHQFAVRAADVHRLDNPLGAALLRIQINHPDGLALFQGLFKFQRQQTFAR